MINCNIIDFAEFVGINTYDGTYMRHEINSFGRHKWKLYYENEYITSIELYQRFCDNVGIDFTPSEKISYYNNEFQPINFIEYIGICGFFYYRWSFNGIQQQPYWTISGKEKIKTTELYDNFKINNL